MIVTTHTRVGAARAKRIAAGPAAPRGRRTPLSMLTGCMLLGLLASVPVEAQRSARGDLDRDGVPTVAECTSRRDCPDSDGDGRVDARDADDDGDGIPTRQEHYSIQGIVVVDRVTKERRYLQLNDVDQDGVPNWLDLDSDDDGKSDALERSALPGGRQVVSKERLPDRDGDGLPDVIDRNDEDGPLGDLDGDGLPNAVEDWFGTDKYWPDTDGDGVDDGVEILNGDTDGDGILDIFDTDDDGDGVLTQNEYLFGDEDGDGIVAYLDTDSDGDGVLDGEDSYTDECVGVPSYPDFREPEFFFPQCFDRDCDGIPDVAENQAAVYVGPTGGFLAQLFGTATAGTTVYPDLQDGSCAMEDWDCDTIPNWTDPNWTDGPCWTDP